MIGHLSPEAESGGPLALITDGDGVRIDVTAQTIDLMVRGVGDQWEVIRPAELALRHKAWTGPACGLPLTKTRGVLAKFARAVKTPAALHCQTNQPQPQPHRSTPLCGGTFRGHWAAAMRMTHGRLTVLNRFRRHTTAH